MDKIKRLFKRSTTDKTVAAIRRRRTLIALLYRRLTSIVLLLFVAGFVWMVAIPLPQLGRWTYIDENALQPGQVNTYWNWGEVHDADVYLGEVERLCDANATSDQRAEFFMTEFHKLGLLASSQGYSFTTSARTLAGTNAYAILSSPRTAGTEAIVISASWLSRTGEGDGTLNLRGISTVLALAKFLKQYSLWAKDIVFVISDGYLDGMQAWLSAYHGATQANMQADDLSLSSGVIWTALNLDYPGHSFSHLGIFFEGLNGRLPNQDLLNSFQRISQYTGGVPVVVYDHLDPRNEPARRDELDILPKWLPSMVRDQADVRAYAYQARNIVRHVGYQAHGQASGVHGLFHKYRIDAITLFAVPAMGPHGFHALGRVVESTLRTANNLLERLHASFFFYVLSGPDRFLKIGNYLPSAVLISVAMMFWGLRQWVDAGWTLERIEKVGGTLTEEKWVRRQRPVLHVLGIMISTHLLGGVLFALVTRTSFIANRAILGPLLFLVVAAVPLTALRAAGPTAPHAAPTTLLLKALNLCLASTVISTTTVLNFSLAASLAVVLGVPLCIATPARHSAIRAAAYAAYTLLGLGWLVFGQEQMHKAVWNWEVLAVWFAPFVCIIYAPLVLQAGIVCLLAPT